MKNKKTTEMYYDNMGNPKGYRVGITDDTYGVCPFCGNSYSEQDIKDGKVNFEHIYSRFGAKKAINEKKIFSKVESDFMVAVHKDCNTDNGKGLEEQISKIIANLNKPGATLLPKDAITLFNYCIKTSVFLGYLTNYENVPKAFCYNNEKIGSAHSAKPKFYEYFDIRIRHVDSSAGLWWNLNDPHPASKYCFTSVIGEALSGNDIEISFYPVVGEKFLEKYGPSDPHGPENAVYITKKGDVPMLLSGEDYYKYYHLDDPHWLPCFIRFSTDYKSKSVPWKLKKVGIMSYDRFYKNYLQALSSGCELECIPNNYYVRQKKLSLIDQQQIKNNVPFKQGDKGIVFVRNGQIYYVDGDGIAKNVSSLPKNTEISVIDLTNIYKGAFLPHMSQLKIIHDFICTDGNLESLDNMPKHILGNVNVNRNKLKTLRGAPVAVKKSFKCDFNRLVTLQYAPKKAPEGFSCTHNKLTSLDGAPQQIGRWFTCAQNRLTSLKGAPKLVNGWFSCIDNKLKSFDCPDTIIQGTLFFDAKYLKSLDGLPHAREYLVSDCHRTFRTVDELRAWFTEYKKGRDKKKKQSLHVGTKKLKSANDIHDIKKQIVPDDQHGM